LYLSRRHFTKEPSMTFSIPFPQDLYNMIVIRSGGRLDPVALAASQVEAFVERNRFESDFWTEDGLQAFDDEELAPAADYGDPNKGHLWSPLFLRNGTELRMQYKGTIAYARIVHDKVTADGKAFDSVSQWVRHVAQGTSRNAWLDVWVRIPGEKDFKGANGMR
jgi:hypothetical protein